MSTKAQTLAVLALVGLALLVTSADAAQNLRKTTCPLCDMDVRPEISAKILGQQAIYACEMAGHIDDLQNQPKKNLGKPVAVDLSKDVVYKDATEMACPVCGKGFTELKYAVPWVSMGDQKIFACSHDHAMEVFNNPSNYVIASGSTGGFCNRGAYPDKPRGSVMFNGFQLAIGEDAWCALLLFQPWVLTSGVKYALAFIGVVLLAMSMEAFGEYREKAEKRLYQRYGIIYTAADYYQLATPTVTEGTSKPTEQSMLNAGGPGVTVYRRIPFWCKAVLACFYMINLTVAYWLMLIIMMYESLFFFAVVLGLALGFFFFKDTEADKMSGNIDPCCST